jgi:hypothetical protein
MEALVGDGDGGWLRLVSGVAKDDEDDDDEDEAGDGDEPGMDGKTSGLTEGELLRELGKERAVRPVSEGEAWLLGDGDDEAMVGR